MKELILIFDISREKNSTEKKVNRDLHKLKAKMLQHSVWKSNDLQSLTDIAIFIKRNGGTARILEEKFIF